jgi:hypothetical protein
MAAGKAWILFGAVLLALGIAFLLLRASSREGRELFARERRLRCPLSGREALCTLVEDTRTGRWLSVRRCSVAGGGEGVSCGAPCLLVLNHGVLSKGRRRPARRAWR